MKMVEVGVWDHLERGWAQLGCGDRMEQGWAQLGCEDCV